MTVEARYLDQDRVDIIEGQHLKSVPLEAVASRMELLGYEDPADALAACLAEMDMISETHPYDQVYASYLPYLLQQRGKRPEAPVGGAARSASPAAASEDDVALRLDQARRAARAEIGAPEPRQVESETPLSAPQAEAAASGEGSYAEVVARLRAEPSLPRLRERFRGSILPVQESENRS